MRGVFIIKTFTPMVGDILRLLNLTLEKSISLVTTDLMELTE